jgi:hypothetical protein
MIKNLYRKLLLGVLMVTLSAQSLNATTWNLSDTKVNHLMAGDVCEAAGLKERVKGRMRLGVQNWSSPDQILSWPIKSRAAGTCKIILLINAPQVGTSFTVSSKAGSVELKTSEKGWHRLAGTLQINKGSDTISLKLTQKIRGKKKAEIVAVEVITEKHLPSYKKQLVKVKSLQGDTSWFKEAGYGIMFQWGNWGFPRTGDKKEPWNKVYEEFDIEAFADKMKLLNPGYIIWSITWRGSRFSMPLESVDKIMGSKEFTMKYDFVGKLADALNKRGIPMFLYYHPGAEEPQFWATVWKGHDNTGPWQDAKVAIWTEIGERLGKKLAGWFVDNGMPQYYPADFFRYIKALKAGNPKRLVSFNPGKFTNCTPYEDVAMGVNHISGKIENSLLTSGPSKGLIAHYMAVMDGPDWGVWRKNTKIKAPRGGVEVWQKKVDKAKKNGHPVSFCILMYEDGTLGEKTEAILKQLKR